MTGSTLSMPWLSRAQLPQVSVDTPDAQTPRPDDAEVRHLISKIARGDEAAFRRVYDLYHERLFRLTMILTRGDEQLARETLQCVFTTAASKLRRIETEDHLWNWLALIARQHVTRAWHQRQRESNVISVRELPDNPEPRAAAADAELEKSLDAALLLMDAEDRQIIEWFYFDHLSHKEIADLLSTTPKAISSRLERARVKLKVLLKRKLSE